MYVLLGALPSLRAVVSLQSENIYMYCTRISYCMQVDDELGEPL